MHCIGRQTVEQTLSLFGSSVVQYAIFWYLVLQSNSGMVMTGAMVAAAVRQVTDSKAAKEQADAEAAAQAQAQAQAAQAQAAAAAAQPQSSYSQSYNRYGGSGSGYSSNRGYSAPKQSYTPSNNGGSSTGGSNLADLIGAASGGQGIGPSDGSTGIIYH